MAGTEQHSSCASHAGVPQLYMHLPRPANADQEGSPTSHTPTGGPVGERGKTIDVPDDLPLGWASREKEKNNEHFTVKTTIP